MFDLMISNHTKEVRKPQLILLFDKGGACHSQWNDDDDYIDDDTVT